jgi:hypothetical protein
MDPRLVWTMVGVGVVALIVSAEMPPQQRLLLYLVYGGVFYALYRWQTQPKSRVTSAPPLRDFEIPNEAEIRLVERLPVEEALQRVEERLGDNSAWTRLETPEEAYSRMKTLTPNQQAFFRKHGGLKAMFGEARLGADAIRAFKWPASTVLPFSKSGAQPAGARSQPFTQIGVDFDGNPILATRGEETVYVVHGTRSNADKWWCANYQSLYHWMLVAEIQLKS